MRPVGPILAAAFLLMPAAVAAADYEHSSVAFAFGRYTVTWDGPFTCTLPTMLGDANASPSLVTIDGVDLPARVR